MSELLAAEILGDGKTCTPFGTTASKHLAAVGGGHSFTESVLVHSLTIGGLISSFHSAMLLSFLLLRDVCHFFFVTAVIRGAKLAFFLEFTKFSHGNI